MLHVTCYPSLLHTFPGADASMLAHMQRRSSFLKFDRSTVTHFLCFAFPRLLADMSSVSLDTCAWFLSITCSMCCASTLMTSVFLFTLFSFSRCISLVISFSLSLFLFLSLSLCRPLSPSLPLSLTLSLSLLLFLCLSPCPSVSSSLSP